MTQPLSCTIIINELYMGGAQRLAIDQAHEIYRRGVDVYLITLRHERGSSMRGDVRLPADHVLEIPFGSLVDVVAWVKLVRTLRHLKIELVITSLWFANFVGRIAAYLAGVRKILTFEQNVYDGVKSWKQFLADRLLQRLSTRIVAVSDAVRTSLVAQGIDTKRVVVIYNSIDPARYQGVAPAPLREELRLSPTTGAFLCIGRLTKQKGLDILLRAFERVVGDVALCIVGVGEDEQVLNRLAGELKIQDRVFFLGSRSDIPALLHACDCFVLASRWEGYPVVVLEALVTHTPMVVSDFASAREVVPTTQWSSIVKKEDVEELANAMQQRVKAGRGRAVYAPHVVEVCSVRRNVDQLFSLL